MAKRPAGSRPGRAFGPAPADDLRIAFGWAGLPQALRGAAVALGNFDGVHRAHQQVIASAAVAAALSGGGPVGVIRFDPHPVQVFRPDGPPFLLMTPGQQARVLQALGVHIRYDLPFAAGLASLSEEDFCRDVLVGGLGVRHVSAGYDIRFGKNRTGDADSLRRWGDKLGFSVAIVDAIMDDQGKVSSSAVREALRTGDVLRASQLLGRPFAIEGRVEENSRRGQVATVPLGDYLRPRPGVYGVQVRLMDGSQARGVATVRQTGVDFDLGRVDRDLRGHVVEVSFVSRRD